ncbi:unnamed protein product [Prorocentrum cordatum]|uniref:Uncharacterized protein n=1 Tax=Prorocentrum cordatum TaxID=2364126 RepID=A0ABN9XEU9_9DINO|nr:unnamed protein product [Polarella glacialis]
MAQPPGASGLPELRELLRVEGEPSDSCFRARASLSGERVLELGSSRGARVWDAGRLGAPPHELGVEVGEESLLRGSAYWSPSDSRLALALSAGCLAVADLGPLGAADGQHPARCRQLRHDQGSWPEVAWSGDGSRLATWLPSAQKLRAGLQAWRGGGGHVKVWDVSRQDSEEAPSQLLDHGDEQLGDVAWAPRGPARLLTWCRRGRSGAAGGVRVWDVSGQDAVPLELDNGGRQACDAAWSPDGAEVATACVGGAVCLWAVGPSAAGRGPRELGGELGGASADLARVAWSPDGSLLLASSVCAGLHRRGESADGDVLFELHLARRAPGAAVTADFAVWCPDGAKLVLPAAGLAKLPPPQLWSLGRDREVGPASSACVGAVALPVATGVHAGGPSFAVARCWSPDSTRLAVVEHAVVVGAAEPPSRPTCGCTAPMASRVATSSSLRCVTSSFMSCRGPRTRRASWPRATAASPCFSRQARGLCSTPWAPPGTAPPPPPPASAAPCPRASCPAGGASW